jgi:hypothetical protein
MTTGWFFVFFAGNGAGHGNEKTQQDLRVTHNVFKDDTENFQKVAVIFPFTCRFAEGLPTWITTYFNV